MLGLTSTQDRDSGPLALDQLGRHCMCPSDTETVNDSRNTSASDRCESINPDTATYRELPCAGSGEVKS